MSPPPPAPATPDSFDPQAEMARERNRIAADRTLLAWIRTGLTLVGVGFGIDQAVQGLYSRVGALIDPLRLSHVLGLTLVGLGTVTVVLAAIDHRQELRRLRQPHYVYTPRHRLGETVSLALLAIALLCALWIGGRVIWHGIRLGF